LIGHSECPTLFIAWNVKDYDPVVSKSEGQASVRDEKAPLWNGSRTNQSVSQQSIGDCLAITDSK
jgi:hypothetical protein